jgi:hypothetical protein
LGLSVKTGAFILLAAESAGLAAGASTGLASGVAAGLFLSAFGFCSSSLLERKKRDRQNHVEQFNADRTVALPLRHRQSN